MKLMEENTLKAEFPYLDNIATCGKDGNEQDEILNFDRGVSHELQNVWRKRILPQKEQPVTTGQVERYNEIVWKADFFKFSLVFFLMLFLRGRLKSRKIS